MFVYHWFAHRFFFATGHSNSSITVNCVFISVFILNNQGSPATFVSVPPGSTATFRSGSPSSTYPCSSLNCIAQEQSWESHTVLKTKHIIEQDEKRWEYKKLTVKKHVSLRSINGHGSSKCSNLRENTTAAVSVTATTGIIMTSGCFPTTTEADVADNVHKRCFGDPLMWQTELKPWRLIQPRHIICCMTPEHHITLSVTVLLTECNFKLSTFSYLFIIFPLPHTMSLIVMLPANLGCTGKRTVDGCLSLS